jgi:hypothetical protein
MFQLRITKIKEIRKVGAFWRKWEHLRENKSILEKK